MRSTVQIQGWEVSNLSFVTKGFDPTQVTKYVLTKGQYEIEIEEFFGDWKLERTLTQGQFLESYQGIKSSEVDSILHKLGAPSLDDIEEAFDPGDFDDRRKEMKTEKGIRQLIMEKEGHKAAKPSAQKSGKVYKPLLVHGDEMIEILAQGVTFSTYGLAVQYAEEINQLRIKVCEERIKELFGLDI